MLSNSRNSRHSNRLNYNSNNNNNNSQNKTPRRFNDSNSIHTVICLLDRDLAVVSIHKTSTLPQVIMHFAFFVLEDKFLNQFIFFSYLLRRNALRAPPPPNSSL